MIFTPEGLPLQGLRRESVHYSIYSLHFQGSLVAMAVIVAWSTSSPVKLSNGVPTK